VRGAAGSALKGKNPMAPLLTIIMPVYNEEESIVAAVEEIETQILQKVPDSELLAIDDGSKDSSPALLDDLAHRIKGVRVEHKPNGGHGDALRYGLDRAQGEYFFLLDSDRQIPVEDFHLLWPRRGKGKLVCGIRTNRNDPAHRLILTRFVRMAVWVLFGRYIRDANIPFKLLHRQVWEKFSACIPRDTLAPSLFLAAAAAKDPKVVFESIPVRHLPRTTGATVLKPLKLYRFCRRAFRQMLQFRKDLKRLLNT